MFERKKAGTLVISEAKEGFRVYSPEDPKTIYLVAGSPETPTCTCPEFDGHDSDPDYRCPHILAVFEEAQPVISRAERTEKLQSRQKPNPVAPSVAPQNGNGASQMLLKRSVSPDGRIDSLSVEFSCGVEKATGRDIKTRAVAALKLQDEIIETFLGNGRTKRPNGNGEARGNCETPTNGAIPAELVAVQGMDTKWGRRLFISVQANGDRLRLFGSRKQLGEALVAAGRRELSDDIREGLSLRVPCRVTTKPSPDGRYVNVERVLPPASNGGRRTGR